MRIGNGIDGHFKGAAPGIAFDAQIGDENRPIIQTFIDLIAGAEFNITKSATGGANGDGLGIGVCWCGLNRITLAEPGHADIHFHPIRHAITQRHCAKIAALRGLANIYSPESDAGDNGKAIDNSLGILRVEIFIGRLEREHAARRQHAANACKRWICCDHALLFLLLRGGGLCRGRSALIGGCLAWGGALGFGHAAIQ